MHVISVFILRIPGKHFGAGVCAWLCVIIYRDPLYHLVYDLALYFLGA